MNERIREIAKQTGYIWHASGDPQIYEFTPEKLDEFAELIVRECARVAMNTDLRGERGERNVLYVAHTQIKQHFGVEE